MSNIRFSQYPIQKLQIYINDLLHNLNQKDEAIEKAARVIESLKQDFERVVKDLRRTEKEKETVIKEQKQMEKEFSNTRRDLNQIDTLKKLDEKHKVLYTQQKDKNEFLINQFQERDQQSNNQIEQLQEQINSLRDLIEDKSYELESQSHQYKVKENGFSNALQSLQDKEDLIVQQDLQIKELIAQQNLINQDYLIEIQTLKRLAENFYRNDQKQLSGIKNNRIDINNTKRKNKTPTKREDDAYPDDDLLGDNLINYKNDLQIQMLVNQLILEQKESMDLIRQKLSGNIEFIKFEKEIENSLLKFDSMFQKVNDLYYERNNINILLKDFQFAYEQLKENHESFLQSIKIGILRIETAFDDDEFQKQNFEGNTNQIQLLLSDQMPRLIELIQMRQKDIQHLKFNNQVYQEELKNKELNLQEVNLALQHYKQMYTEDYQLKQGKLVIEQSQKELQGKQDDSLMLKYKSLIRQFDDVQQINKNLTQHNQMLKQELSIKQQENSQDNEKEDLQEQNQILMEQLNQLSQEHAQTVDMFGKALNDLEELQSGEDKKNLQDSRMISQLNEFKEMLDLSQQNETNLDQQVNEYQQQVVELENHCQQLQNDLHSQDQIIKELQRKMKQYKFELKESENRVNQVQSQFDLQDGDDVLTIINPVLDIYLSSQMNITNHEQQVLSTNKLYSGNSFESFGRLGEHQDSLKDGSARFSKHHPNRSSNNKLTQKIILLQEQVNNLVNSQFHLIDGIVVLLKERKSNNKNDIQMLVEFDNDFQLFKTQQQHIGLIKFVEEFSQMKQLFLEVVEFQLTNVKELNTSLNNKTELVRSQRTNSEFHSGQIEMMTRFIQCIHQIAQKYLESVGRGDKPIVDRLEKIVKKYKSLGNNVLAKRSLSLLSSTCHILLQVFRLWKEHVINVSEILFEVGEGARQITLNNQYDEQHMLQRFKKFEQKIQESLQLIEKDTFSSRIDQNLMQIEIVADKIQNTTFESLND